MKDKIRWGILSTAKIGREKVIPGLQKSNHCQVVAIASRNIEQAKSTAALLNIEKAYGSYEELLSDSEIEAIYIPLPNNMHVEWAIKSLQAGKHVLCEKPIGISAEEAAKLLKVSNDFPQLKIMEAFMYHFHPQWQKVKSIINENGIGDVKTIHSFFSYYNVDPTNIRNKTDANGGTLMDIGCYCISFPRFILDAEPVRALGIMDLDPKMKTDRITSGILDFSNGITSTFTCSTQLMPYQRVHIVGTEGRIEIEIPVNTPINAPTHIWVHTKNNSQEIIIEPVDQYSLQGDYFSLAILNDSKIQYSLNDAIGNMKVIDAIVESAEKDVWVKL
jgi:predicted dehydrogenase